MSFWKPWAQRCASSANDVKQVVTVSEKEKLQPYILAPCIPRPMLEME